jgi:aromatic ring hydroxylase
MLAKLDNFVVFGVFVPWLTRIFFCTIVMHINGIDHSVFSPVHHLYFIHVTVAASLLWLAAAYP